MKRVGDSIWYISDNNDGNKSISKATITDMYIDTDDDSIVKVVLNNSIIFRNWELTFFATDEYKKLFYSTEEEALNSIGEY